MSNNNTYLYNLTNSKKNVVINRNGEVNRVMQYLGGDSLVYRNIYIQNENNLENSGIISCDNKTLTLESNNIMFSGNISLNGENLSISGGLNMSCNSIIGASEISFCRDDYISSGSTFSFDLMTDGILTLQADENSSIICKNRIVQNIPASENYSNITGNYEIAKNTYQKISSAYSNKVVIEWTTRTSATNNNWLSVCWSPELGIFVAVANNGTGNRVMTSPNGINWTIRSSAADNIWRSVCWSPKLGILVAVSSSGSGNRVMTSPDGINWTSRASAADNDWMSVCWSPELGIFVAVSFSGNGNRVMTSPDGITWTIRSSAADNQWLSVCWSPELRIFVAVSTSGTGNRVMTSSDGINWTSRASAADNDWRGVCWSPELGIFVAVSFSGNGNRVMTSPDGITWTIRSSAADNQWLSVCWSPELGIFVAVSNSGLGNRVMTSPDGINWTTRTSAVDNQWFSVCWSAELGIFVAVSATGTGNRVMTSSLKGRIPTSYNIFDSPSNRIDEQGNFTIQQTLKRGAYTSAVSTPSTASVLGANLLYLVNSSPKKLITNFTGATPNQEIVLVFFDSFTEIENNANIKLKGGANFTGSQNSTLTLLYTGTLWVEISRSINPI